MENVGAGESVKPSVKVGALASLLGFLLVFVGLFGSIGTCAVPGATCPSPSWNEIVFYLGVVVLVLGIVLLIWAAWRGGPAGWYLAAAAAVPAIWTLYELGRQSLCPRIGDRAISDACLTAFGEMTAPVLSIGLAGLLLFTGWLRMRQLRSSRDIPRR